MANAVTVPLPIPDDPQLNYLMGVWPEWANLGRLRSQWLKAVEDVLRAYYPSASSDQLTLTARNLAPFPLALPGVP